MQHVANNVMIGDRNLHEKGDEMERKRGFEIVSAMKEKESLFQNVLQNIQQDMTSKLPKISYYQAFGKCFSNLQPLN